MFYLNAYLFVSEQYELVEILGNWKIIKSSYCYISCQLFSDSQFYFLFPVS